MTTRSTRAEPLAPDDRRRAIIAAVIPLLTEHGSTVTTKQMAEAAGIAEGTIFRVFPDKHALIHEAVRFSMDPAPVVRALSEIDQSTPFEVQLTAAARIIFERFQGVIALITALRTSPSPDAAPPAGPPPFVAEANAAINGALTELFERHRDRLRIEPARATAAFRGLILASGHPMMGHGEKLAVDEIVDVLLTGIADPVSEVGI
ncbi:MAG TPA: TetR/AcrR family transcriptional regulator [Acidimicrobiia bacterium]